MLNLLHSKLNGKFSRCLINCRDDYKYNTEAIDTFIRTGLVSMPQYDAFLSSLMENGLNLLAINFAMQLLQRFCVDEKHNPHGITEVRIMAVFIAHILLIFFFNITYYRYLFCNEIKVRIQSKLKIILLKRLNKLF